MTEQPNHYFRALGLEPVPDGMKAHEKLREAYDRAHDIRKFEIQMYWTRSAYLWTIQAAALAGLALIASEFEAIGWQCKNTSGQEDVSCFANQFRFILLVAIWSFGAFTAYVWLLLLKGAKHWQNNWERHVDLLEDGVSGALYKTYPVNMVERPYSVSTLNELMAKFMLVLWMLIGASSSSLYLQGTPGVYLAPIIFSLLFFVAWYCDSCLRMTGEARPVEGTSGLFQRTAPTFESKTENSDSRTS